MGLGPTDLPLVLGSRRDDLPDELSEAVAADFALPYDENTPARLPQLPLMCPISPLGALQLGPPIVHVTVRDATVSAPRVLVPEAAVDEDCRRVAPQHDVRPPRKPS